MLTTICLTLLAAAIGAVYATGYWIGRTRRPRSEDYFAARAEGYRKGIRHGENARTALHKRVDELEAALDEMGARYDRLLADRWKPIAREIVGAKIRAEVYDHTEAGL